MSKYTKENLGQLGALWINRIRAVEQDEEKWRKSAKVAETAYLAGQTDDGGVVPDWNILHSNVETIVPAVYNSTPAPDIRARHNNKDKMAKHVADVWERAIATQIDDSALDLEMEAEAQDAFMAGRGIIRLRFDAEVEDVINEYDDGMEETAGQRVVDEKVLYENVSWRDYREGPAKRWRDVPWVAYRHFISQRELDRIRDEEMWKLQAEKTDPEGEEVDVEVWEIWCKQTEKVYFVVDKDSKVLSATADPLELPGFFPQPEPVQPITATGSRTPICPYSVYKKQADELNKVTKRIQAILSGLKVKGGIAAGAESIQELARAGDNELIPLADVEGLIATGGLDKAISWWPVDKAIVVLRELYAAREQIKNSIYEITGISDIIRGQSAAQETATAQQIKTEWGSLRIKKLQRLIERQVRDVFKLSAEIMSRQFSPESIAKAAGIPYDERMAEMLSKPFDHYRIDVESDSTVRADVGKKREEMARFLEGTGSFFQIMAPLVAQGPKAAGPVAELYASFTRHFNLGKGAEDALENLVEMAQEMAEQPQPNPEAEQMKADMQMKGQELELKKAEGQAKMQVEGAKLELDKERIELDREQFMWQASTQGADIQDKKLQSLANIGGELAQVLGPIVQAIAVLAEQMTARDQLIVDAIQAPKRVVKDQNGRPIGIETDRERMI